MNWKSEFVAAAVARAVEVGDRRRGMSSHLVRCGADGARSTLSQTAGGSVAVHAACACGLVAGVDDVPPVQLVDVLADLEVMEVV